MSYELCWFIACVAICGISIVVVTGHVLSLRLALRQRPPAVPDCDLPPVTILKPLKGVDEGLGENLLTFCNLDYPAFQIVFCVENPDDPAMVVARSIRDRRPELDISIPEWRPNDCVNPKVRNMLGSLHAAKHGILLVSDSNVRVRPSYLRDTVQTMLASNADLVSNIIVAADSESLGATFENIHLSGFVAGNVALLDDVFGMPCVVGKSMLIRREALEGMGGFAAFGDVLAEDYIMGRDFARAGRTVALSGHVIRNVVRRWSPWQFVKRHMRWSKMRWKIGGIAYFSEALCYPTVLSLPVVLTAPSRSIGLSLFGGLYLFKVTADLLMGRMLQAGLNPAWYALSPVKDLIICAVNLVPFFDNTIEWRGNHMRVGKDSRLSKL